MQNNADTPDTAASDALASLNFDQAELDKSSALAAPGGPRFRAGRGMQTNADRPDAAASDALASLTFDQAEPDKSSALAARWWDPESEFNPLHAINPLRLGWIRDLAGPLAGKKI